MINHIIDKRHMRIGIGEPIVGSTSVRAVASMDSITSYSANGSHSTWVRLTKRHKHQRGGAQSRYRVYPS